MVTTLYNSTPEAPQTQWLADCLRRQTGRAVVVLPLSALHTPTRRHLEPLRQQLTEAQERLSIIELLIAVAKEAPRRYAAELYQYQQDQQRHQLLIHTLEGKLRREGGLPQ
jgi:homoserine kinase